MIRINYLSEKLTAFLCYISNATEQPVYLYRMSLCRIPVYNTCSNAKQPVSNEQWTRFQSVSTPI